MVNYINKFTLVAQTCLVVRVCAKWARKLKVCATKEGSK